MAENLTLLCVFAHPDDETLFAGGILAKYAAEDVQTYLICATRGERGWAHPTLPRPDMKETGKFREAELRCAAQALGVRDIFFLDYIDGELDQAPPDEAAQKIAAILRRVRPQVVISMDPQGVYGHADHIALTQFTLGGVLWAASPDPNAEFPPHTVSKLYMTAMTQPALEGYSQTFVGGPIRITVDGAERRPTGWQPWQTSAEIDITLYWGKVLEALKCHRSQIRNVDAFANMPGAHPPEMWGISTLYRAFSLVNGGRKKESDLFEGLR